MAFGLCIKAESWYSICAISKNLVARDPLVFGQRRSHLRRPRSTILHSSSVLTKKILGNWLVCLILALSALLTQVSAQQLVVQ